MNLPDKRGTERFVVVVASNKRGHGLKLVQLDPFLFNVEMKTGKELDPHAEFPDLLQDRMGKL